MDYEKIISLKNKVVILGLAGSVSIRVVWDLALKAPIQTIIGMVIVGYLLCALGWVLNKKKIVMPTMYYMTLTLTAVGWTMMLTSPGWANLLVFYYLIFIVLLYQDIKPIIIQSLFSGGSIIYFFIKHKETVFKDVGYDN